ncbi:hypothetical protein CK498_24410 [Halomonas salipaludis]|uniref:Antitoxin Xre/MbcA/ParS-like toxin-binding domain-containing protein n=1 Tax=Halomonas salipaludis TaxID=2032625 RepID=A0A2A2EP25_9GAMM|nr:hypothetical protein CK498_24410 [Halomonas salipaludis]
MSRQRYTEEFKVEAIKQVTERGHPVAEVVDAEAVLDYVVNVFEDADIAREWLHCEVPALSGSRPMDLLGTSRGRQSIREALGKIECGEFS